MDNRKKLLQRWGENTAYSAKCHFKMHDLSRYWIYVLVIINILFAVFSLLDFGENYQKLCVLFSIISLIASILLLVHEAQTDRNTSFLHKDFGEKYLALHYDISALYYTNKIVASQVEEIKEQIKKLNQSSKPSINIIGKWWATKAIEKQGEMNTWWKNT